MIIIIIVVLEELASSARDKTEELALSFSSGSAPSGPVRCHAHTISGELCMRVNTVQLYMEANRVVSIMTLCCYGNQCH